MFCADGGGGGEGRVTFFFSEHYNEMDSCCI